MADQFSGLSQNSAGGTNKEHEESLIKMGVLPKKEKVIAPEETIYLFEMYKEIRFSATEDNKLLPRTELTFADINEYKQAMQFDLSATEVGVIMRADAIFNKSI